MSNTERKKSGEAADGRTVEHTDEPPEAMLNSEAQDAIGLQLRRVYGEMLSAPIPDKFSELLANLARSERESKG
jgi:hypothetical protein